MKAMRNSSHVLALELDKMISLQNKHAIALSVIQIEFTQINNVEGGVPLYAVQFQCAGEWRVLLTSVAELGRSVFNSLPQQLHTINVKGLPHYSEDQSQSFHVDLRKSGLWFFEHSGLERSFFFFLFHFFFPPGIGRKL